LQDLVSYNERHNEANGENNQDGHGHNLSWNCGVEGPSDDPQILALRGRLKRALLATVFLSQGVPMLLSGDELSRSQGGNNNAYAQDNETNWLDWGAGLEADPALPEFVRTLIGLRTRFEAFRRRTFLTGAPVAGTRLKDVYWLAPEGREMTHGDWSDGQRRTLGLQLGNDAADNGRFLVLMNAAAEPVPFRLAADFPLGPWAAVFDSALPDGLVRGEPPILEPGGTFPLPARSLVLFQHARAGA
jgi:isoamylase